MNPFGSLLDLNWIYIGSLFLLDLHWIFIGSLLYLYWISFGSLLDPYWISIGYLLSASLVVRGVRSMCHAGTFPTVEMA